MSAQDFEGTLVLEKLAEINRVEAFYEAFDADDFGAAKSLMKQAGIDSETIQAVLEKLRSGDD